MAIRRVFPGGNTSEGFYSYHSYIVNGVTNRTFILKGGPGSGKSTIMKEIGKKYEKYYTVEYHHCPSDSDSVDAVVLVEPKIAVIDGTAPHSIDPTMPGLLDEIVDLGKYIDESIISNYKDKILKAKFDNKNSYRSAYSFFRASSEILGEIVQNRKNVMDYVKINHLLSEMIGEIFRGCSYGFKVGGKRHLFNQALTPAGLIDYTETLVNNTSHKYIIEGNYGTGKDTILRRIADEAVFLGLDVEIFHQPLMPRKINSIIIPQLSVSIITNKIDIDNVEKVIDLNDFLIENIDLEDYNNIFYLLVERGIEKLKLAKTNHELLENYYYRAIDFDGINDEKNKILDKINNLL